MRLFITYAHDDIDRVRTIAEVFSAAGHLVWFDEQLLPGQDWKAKLHDEIARCDVFVYGLSTASVSSEWCGWEFATAVELRKAILPILLGDEPNIPSSLRTLQYADLRQGITPIATAKLLGALALMQKVPVAEAPAIPREPKGIPSRAWESFNHWTDNIVTAQHAPQSDSERICGKFSANLFRSWGPVGGRIIITNRRLLFEAHRINLQREPLQIALSAIESVAKSWNLGLIPNAFTIKMRTGEKYQFVVWGRERIIAMIEELRRSMS